jgi:microcystin-dependent protein
MPDASLGEIRMFAGNFAPRDWALCDGRHLSNDEHRALHALIGDTYGTGDNSFRVPDMRDRTPVQRDARNGLQIGRPRRICFEYADDGERLQEFLCLTFIIAIREREHTSRDSWLDDVRGPMLGEIRIFGCNLAPRGWAFCDGRMIRIVQNTALFSILGTAYGGDGRQTYALPDLRNRIPIGASFDWSNERGGPGSVARGRAVQPSATGDRAQSGTLALNFCISTEGQFPDRE